MRSASAGGSIAASFAPAAAASFFRLTSWSDGTSTQTVALPAFAIRVFSRRAGSNAERLGRLHADARRVRIVVVLMQLEGDAGLRASATVAGVPFAISACREL